MRYILAITLFLCACGSIQLPKSVNAAEIQAIADKTEIAIDYAKQGMEAGHKTGEALCAAFEKICDPIEVAEASATKSIEVADESMAAYRAGKASYADLSAAVEGALRSVKNFLEFLDATRKQSL